MNFFKMCEANSSENVSYINYNMKVSKKKHTFIDYKSN